MTRRHAAIAALALVPSLLAAGCSEAPPSPPISLFTGPWTAVAIGATAAPIAYAQRHGPTVTIVNRSDTPIDARFWVAKVDVSKAAGHELMESDDRLTVRVQPNELLLTDVGRSGWVTGQNDALVWIRLIPSSANNVDNAPMAGGRPDVLLPPTQRPSVEPTWLDFTRPGPYKIEITGHFDPSAPNDGLAYHPLEDTAFKPLPRDSWIEHHDGHYPAP